MKTLISFLLLFSILGGVRVDALGVDAVAREGSYRWYVKRNSEHLVPELPSEFSFLSEQDGWYCGIDSQNGTKPLYLTFDAGYENGNIARILDILKEKDVPAAFFVLAHLVRRETALVQRMLDEGHLVCNHTASHKDLSRAGAEEFKRELTALESVYRDALGCELSRYYRPPEGTFSLDNLKTAKEMGYKTVFWSFAYADWDNGRQPNPESAVRKVLDHTHPGAVILLHPTSATNASILPILIDSWRADGYTFGTLDELTGSGT